MTKTEHLLICLSEECSEIIQAVSKALRFGLDNDYLGNTCAPNFQDIEKELDDLQGVIAMLKQEGIVFKSSMERIRKKIEKIEKYTGVAKIDG